MSFDRVASVARVSTNKLTFERITDTPFAALRFKFSSSLRKYRKYLLTLIKNLPVLEERGADDNLFIDIILLL